MGNSEKLPWVQVIDRIAVHRPGRESHEPTGSSRLLLCILVAAGPTGASVEEIASAYWGDSRPQSWMIALRVSASHLRTRLPDGWNVVLDDGQFRLVPGDGFIDIWRVETILDAPYRSDSVLDWFIPGIPFAGVTGVDLIDTAVRRFSPLMLKLAAQTAMPGQQLDSLPLSARSEVQRLEWIQGLRRAIVIATPADHLLIASASLADVDTQTHVIVGDRLLQLPLGPFAMAFPKLRNEINLDQSVVESGAVEKAFRIITDMFAVQAAQRPQRLLIAKAGELDACSIELTSRLIERGKLNDFSLILCADPADNDLQWSNFVNRSATAGCDLTDFAAD